MYIKHNIYFCNGASLFLQGWVIFLLIDTGTKMLPMLVSPKQIPLPEGRYPYLSQQLLHALIAHLMLTPPNSPSQPCFAALCPALTLTEPPLSASEYSFLLLPRVPWVSSFMAHCCHACSSPLGRCAIPNSASNLHIRIYVAGSAERRKSATAIHLLQAGGEGKSSKDSSNC